MRRLSPLAKCVIAGAAGAASGFGLGKAVFESVSLSNPLATGVIKIVLAQFLGTIGAVIVFIIVMKVLKDPDDAEPADKVR